MSISTSRNGALSISDIYRKTMDKTLKYDGTHKLFTFGYNSHGLLGHNDLLGRSSPTQITSFQFKDISSNSYCSFGVTQGGDLYNIGGLDYHGSSGTNGNVGGYRSSPTLISASGNWSSLASFGAYSSIALKTDGTAWAWGYNNYGQLGHTSVIPRSSPVQIPGNWKYAALDSNLAYTGFGIKSDSTLWAWGYNTYGPLGQNDQIYRSSPIQIGTKAYKYADIQYHSGSALTIANEWFRWGYNAQGQLGLGDVNPRSSPAQIPGNWAYISKLPADNGYGYRNFGITNNGSLYAFGENTYGVLGLGDVVPRSSPIQIPGNWVYAEFGSYQYSAHGFKSDNSLWGWGYNGYGELGVNDTFYRSTPTQVGTSYDWDPSRGIMPVTHGAFAFKQDGTLWCLGGYNYYGQLGLGDTIQRSAPIQVPGNWKRLLNKHRRPDSFYGTLGLKFD